MERPRYGEISDLLIIINIQKFICKRIIFTDDVAQNAVKWTQMSAETYCLSINREMQPNKSGKTKKCSDKGLERRRKKSGKIFIMDWRLDAAWFLLARDMRPTIKYLFENIILQCHF